MSLVLGPGWADERLDDLEEEIVERPDRSSLEKIHSARRVLIQLMDIYLSSISNRMNEIMKTLTIMASIFIPLTFIEGIYGMNFYYMPELRWRYGYPAVWAVMITTAAGMIPWLYHRGWLERARPSGLEKKTERARG